VPFFPLSFFMPSPAIVRGRTSRVHSGMAIRPGGGLLDLAQPAQQISRPYAATNCTPTGNPVGVMCSGSEIAGWPAMFHAR